MKLLILFSILALSLAEDVIENDQFEPILTNYHESYGIKKAAEIKAAEEATDFSGSRIVGGSEARVGQFPHFGGLVITLTNGVTSVCGSSLISNNRAVTAAHCWNDGVNQARQFVVVFASITLFSGGTRITTNNVVMHPNWNPRLIINDVAVIRLSWVNYNNNIRNIPLASGTNTFAGAWSTACGFGAQRDGAGIGSNQRLHFVSLQVITNAVCAQTFGTSSIIASTICTSGANGRSTCGGDSGGPLETNVGNVRTLIGITSFGARAGCQRGFPAAFARVSSFRAWLLAN